MVANSSLSQINLVFAVCQLISPWAKLKRLLFVTKTS